MNKNKIKISQPNIIVIKPHNITTAQSNNKYKCKKQTKIGVTTRNKLRTNTLDKTKLENTIPINTMEIATPIDSNSGIINLTDDSIIFDLYTNKIVTNSQIIIREDIKTISSEATILKDKENPIRKEYSIKNYQNIVNNNINNNNNNNNNNQTNNYEKVDYRNIATLIAKQPSEENHQIGFRKVGNSSSAVTNIINNNTTASTYHNQTYENNDYEDLSYSYVHKLKRVKFHTNSQKQNPTTEIIPITTTHSVIRPEPLRSVPLQNFITNQQQIRSPERPASFGRLDSNQTIILQQPITNYQNDSLTLPQYQNIEIYNNIEQPQQPEQQSQHEYQKQQEVDDLPPNTNHKLVFKMFTQDLPFYEQCKENLIQLNQYDEIYDVSDHWGKYKSSSNATNTTEYQTNNNIVIQQDQTSVDEPKDKPVEDDEILVVTE